MKTSSKIRILVLLAVLVLGGMLVARLFTGPASVQIAEKSTLVVDLAGNYVEAPAASPLARLAGDQTRPFIGLLSLLRMAERDDRIATVVLRIQPLQIGWAKAEEIREAIGRLRAAGRHTVAQLEIASFSANREIYVASAADEIFVTPGATLPLVGLAAEYLFLGGLMEKIGVEFDVAKAGRYKSAVEAYAERSMSEAAREMANSLLDDTYARFVEAIAEGRGLTMDAVLDSIDRGLVRSQRLEALGLIDGEMHLDQILARHGDSVVRHEEYARVDPAALGIEPRAHFALIYGTGTVVQGDLDDSPFATSRVFASETVSRALLEAAEDPEIDAIVLRIDSPGGSALASELIWRAIRRARDAGKPVIASFSDVAASGGYYVASAVDAIVASPGTLTGSIGVFALRPAVGGLLQKLEIGVDSLTRGRHADFLLASQKLSDGALARLQTSVLDTYRLFLTRVSDGRGLDVEAVDEVAQGRVWTGRQAFDVGLVDELGGLYTAVRRAKEAAGLEESDDVFLIPYPRPKSLGEQLFETLQGATALVDAPTPFEWPEPLDALVDYARLLQTGSPLLIPPALVEIR
ncbi:MAG: signal peptide peptidase SppA [Deltaproteobacteria bacterium]|jgi:protease-4|nr:signal peptide peptidase SppA [Deltaproteobacteria bacterium]